jgi:integrase
LKSKRGRIIIYDTPSFFGYTLKSKPVHREFLTADELQKITEKQFTTTRLSQVRDFFLFSCYTGLFYADVQKLKFSDIGIGVDGERWIFSYRKKTDTRLAIPLLPIAIKILEVEIAAIAGVNQTLGNRIAKRTFATTVLLRNGVPIETVSRLLGHTNIRTTQLYAKVLDTKVSEYMAPLMGKSVSRCERVNEITESKISVDTALLREKYALASEMAKAS